MPFGVAPSAEESVVVPLRLFNPSAFAEPVVWELEPEGVSLYAGGGSACAV
ncbi:hypothetical protein N599_13640 [Saccharopolyspora erythraea D]|nr:hypothetical protein N599_13640 [Saccharopolyspora erythraea D]